MQQGILAAVAQSGPVTAAKLAGSGGDYALVVRTLEALTRRKLLTRTVRPRSRRGDRAHGAGGGPAALRPPPSRLTGRQREVVEYLRAQGGELPLAQLRAELGLDAGMIDRLEERRVVLAYTRQLRRDPLAHRTIATHQAPPLTAEQRAAYGPIAASLRAGDGAVFLLHGVTGSGKTEVYLRAVAETLQAGRQAMVLVPEIGLTPQTVSRFAGRFPGQVALLHSRLSEGERFDEWQRIRGGEAGVVVGPRSALFSPVATLGLIVLDEEHDGSYKQDRTPRYHAREVAAHLAAADRRHGDPGQRHPGRGQLQSRR